MTPHTLQELAEQLTLCVQMAESAGNKILFIETWAVKSLLVGEFLRPNDMESTSEDETFNDTGDLSNTQIEMMLMRDRGEMDTKNCKPVEGQG